MSAVLFCFNLQQFHTEVTQEDKVYTLKEKKTMVSYGYDFYNCLNDFACSKCAQLSLQTTHKKVKVLFYPLFPNLQGSIVH